MRITFKGSPEEIEMAEKVSSNMCFFNSTFCGSSTCRECGKKHPQQKEFIIIDEKENRNDE